MDQITVMFRLDQTTLEALQKIARDDGVQVSDVVTGALRRDLFRRGRAKKAVRPDERLVAPLRALLARDIALSRDWPDLQARLRSKGYRYQEAGAGLALFDVNTGTRVAKASDVGPSYQRLVRRFGAPFPGHSHRHAARNALSET